MPADCPSVLRTLIIGDDPYFLAQISCLLSRRNAYLPVIEGPRMLRPDAAEEVIRRNNAAARLRPDAIIFAGLAAPTCESFARYFPVDRTHRISSLDELQTAVDGGARRRIQVLTWGSDRIGLGLLAALRGKQEIVFSDNPSQCQAIHSKSGHLVVCEEGNPLAQVIAANYAYSLEAGLCLIPQVPDEECHRILEHFYSLYEDRQRSPTSALEYLRDTLREHAGQIPVDRYRSVTFITGELRWGFAYPETPSTHLFTYPDLGISVLNGVLAEQSGAPGIRVAALVDPGEVEAREVRAAIKSLANRAVFVKGMGGSGATVHSVSRMIELFPYDFLLISTHCGDAPGWRWTYEFVDREGLSRKLVIDLAVGVAIVPENEKLHVVQFERFVSLDGVDWNDPEKKEKLYVGRAIIDYVERTKDHQGLQPVQKEIIDRVPGSAALKMFDGNYIPIPRSLADNGTPIVLNNACASWHRLAKDFTFCNARAYIGTLFSVSDAEAEEVATRLLDRHFGRSLALALWHSQNEVYGDRARRPYVLVGPHFQRLRTTALDAPMFILGRLRRAYGDWARQLQNADPSDDSKVRSIKDYMKYLKAEIEGIHERWLTPRGRRQPENRVTHSK